MTFGTALPVWISADSADIDVPHPADEIFHLAVIYDLRRGEAEYEAQWRPPRSELQATPPDLDLSPFRPAGRRYDIVVEHVPIDERGGPVLLAVERGLLVTAVTGERLLFLADQDVPLDMFVTTRTDYIEQRIAAAASIRHISPEA